MVDITPPLGTHLGGSWGFLRAGEEVFERLYARALVLEQDGLKVAVVAPELEIVTAYWAGRVRDGVRSRCGIEPDATMVAFPQIHSVPPVGNFILSDLLPNVPPEHEYLRGSQRAYCELATEGMIEAVAQADRRLVPVEVAAGRAVRDDLAWNRRGVRRDGSITMPWFYSSARKPLGPTDILYLEGPVDPEVGILALRDGSGRAVAAVLHFTCHPVNVFATVKNAISSDWPGAWAAGVQELLGGDCVALVMNGCCGNINPWPAFTPDFVPDHRRMGRELTRSVEAILPTLSFDSTASLGRSFRRVPLPVKRAKPEDRAWAEAYLRDHPDVLWQKDNPRQAEWEWMDAAMLMSVELEREQQPDYDYEIQAFRVGPAALIGLPGEPFVEGQLAIKQASPAEATCIAHCANDYAGYIAPLASYARGGHEIRERPAMWTRLAPGALERIAAETGSLLAEMFR
jgi:neutral ceramidase